MNKIELLPGERFGKLVVIEEAPREAGEDGKLTPRQYMCKCDCGKYKVASPNKLLNGSVRSCGCSRGKVVEGAWQRNKTAKPCPYPTHKCRDSRAGRCCRECPRYEECAYACLNSPDRCGRNKTKV